MHLFGVSLPARDASAARFAAARCAMGLDTVPSIPRALRDLSEMNSPGPRNAGSGDIGYGFVNLERPGFEQSNNGLRLGASGIGVRAKHGRSGDPGLWVRNKEQ